MARVLGQPLTVLRNEKNILAVEKTTSTERCGMFLAAIFNALSHIVFLRLGTGFFLTFDQI